METKIFYFTGTGNCLAIARKLSTALPSASIASIAQTSESPVQSEVMGIVSPIYMYDMPPIVIDFIRKIQQTDYLFFIYAGGGEPGGGLRKVKKLCRKQGLPLQALFNIAMPSNYTPFGYPEESEQQSLFMAADDKVEVIAEMVAERKQHFDTNPTGLFRTMVHPGILYALGHSQIPRMDRGFSSDASCNSCGICTRICPVNNIALHEGKPHWQGHCEQCFACVNWCPQTAIQYRNATTQTKRYHHPDIARNDILKSSR
ncbi:MAG: hypothetical protein GF401_05000 [Chitinivibrionales bacterium]|nr:hypothetical protein [Chitinivibrionales bacterium]